jgi:hypothetical protein
MIFRLNELVITLLLGLMLVVFLKGLYLIVLESKTFSFFSFRSPSELLLFKFLLLFQVILQILMLLDLLFPLDLALDLCIVGVLQGDDIPYAQVASVIQIRVMMVNLKCRYLFDWGRDVIGVVVVVVGGFGDLWRCCCLKEAIGVGEVSAFGDR